MKNITSILFTVLITFGLILTSQAGQLDTRLEDDLQQKAADEFISVWIVMNDNHDGRALKSSVAASGATKAERYGLALTALKRQARTQENLLNQLRNLEGQSLAQNTKGHWIVNVVEAEIAAAELKNLAARSDVEMIYAEPVIKLIAQPLTDPTPPLSPADASGVTSNLQHIQADVAWANGFTGEGSLVCSFDTGVRGDHPALLSSWKGLDGDSAAAWFDPIYGESFPHYVTDQGGVTAWHGTHTLGIIVGADPDPAYDTVGVAPGAKWIAAAVVDIAGASILDAFEWAADPDGNPNTVADVPDVISHSWGFELMSCADVFYDAIDNTEALGIVNIMAVGNAMYQTGPTNPADRALDSLDCFSVGNINHTTDQLDRYSAEGPSPCNALGIKPNVVAPGKDIWSASYNFEATPYRTGTGTSQAAPHVSGLVALLRQKNPNATVDEIKEAILTTTRWVSAWGEHPNNQFGWGEIDCWEALQALSATNSEPNVRLYDFDLPDITPGDTVTGTLVLQNLGDSVGPTTITVLPTNSALEILDGFLSFGAIAEGDTVRSFDDFSIVVADTVAMGIVLAADLEVESGSYRDTLQLQLVVGEEPGRAMVDHVGSRIEFTVSDFGAFGFSPYSIYNLGGKGFSFDGSEYLWEGGIMVGDSFTRVSSGVHSILFDPDFDFRAVYGGEIIYESPGTLADQQTWAKFDDRRAKNPIGLEITQESFLYGYPNDDFVVLRYAVQNRSASTLTDLYFGLFLDFDIYSEISNAGGYEVDDNFAWMAHNTGTVLSRFRGLRLLKGNLGTAGAFDQYQYHHWPAGSDYPAGDMDGFSTDEKYHALTSGFIYADANKTVRAELGMIVAAGLLTMIPDQTDTLIFAILAGNTLEELRDASLRAERVPADVDEPDGEQLLPAAFALHQNYPNPFNPSTVISFDLPRKSKYRLEIINMLGQTLYETEAIASAGRVEVEWSGEGYASGAYLYRVTVDDRSVTRKMMLLK